MAMDDPLLEQARAIVARMSSDQLTPDDLSSIPECVANPALARLVQQILESEIIENSPGDQGLPTQPPEVHSEDERSRIRDAGDAVVSADLWVMPVPLLSSRFRDLQPPR